MSTIIVSGAIANKCRQGGEAWVRMSWLRGFQRLGFDSWFLEQIDPANCTDRDGKPCSLADSINLQYWREVIGRFGLKEQAVLIPTDGSPPIGAAADRVTDVIDASVLLVNISGHLNVPHLLKRFRCRAYIDIDPGFTQFWHDDPATGFRVDGHDFYYTIGENIGSPDCPIPMGGIPWRPIRQPVVLDDWRVCNEGNPARFTTVANWRGAFGPVQVGGKSYGLKVHEFRKYLSLPHLAVTATRGATRPVFEIALNIHPADTKDLAALHVNGWQITDPLAATDSPDAFHLYVQSSGSEFSVAQGIYVDTNSGWFSDRTVRYLASGKPALVQGTGFSRHITSGTGLISFSTLTEAAEGAARILDHYAEHADAARAIAAKYFDSAKVLGCMLEEMGVH